MKIISKPLSKALGYKSLVFVQVLRNDGWLSYPMFLFWSSQWSEHFQYTKNNRPWQGSSGQKNLGLFLNSYSSKYRSRSGFGIKITEVIWIYSVSASMLQLCTAWHLLWGTLISRGQKAPKPWELLCAKRKCKCQGTMKTQLWPKTEVRRASF